MNSEKLDFIKANLSKIKVPRGRDRVCKSEGCLSFAAPQYSGGLYVNLSTFQSYGEKYLELDHQRRKSPLYLHQQWTKVAIEKKDDVKDDEVKQEPTTMEELLITKASPTWEWKKDHAIVCMPGKMIIPYPNDDFPVGLVEVVEAILAHKSEIKDTSTGFDFIAKESKYAANLIQVDNGKKISPNPNDWECEITGAKHNLWLNLSDGFIGDGRPQPLGWEADGKIRSSGTALQHYHDTGGLYPLVVKLGTVTPNGADVYSYASDENDMVLDPFLSKHLKHWGINMMIMEKTEMTMDELQVEYNLTATFDQVLEAGVELEKVTGAGFVGLTNIGSSCYMNSLMQVLLAIPEFAKKYNDENLLKNSPSISSTHFTTQMAKVAIAVLTDTYIEKKEGKEKEVKEKEVKGSTSTTTVTVTATATGTLLDVDSWEICPKMFRDVVGRGHPDFSTARQQDVFQYYQHILSVIERAEQSSGNQTNLQKLFSFDIEERIQCSVSNKVKYKITQGENVFPLPLATDKGTVIDDELEKPAKKAKSEGKEKSPILRIPFDECIHLFAEPGELDGFYSTETKQKGPATKTTRFASFPKYLVMQVQRFYLGADWSPKKLQHRIPIPEKIDLSALRSTGLRDGETLLPQQQAPAKVQVEPDMNLVGQLIAMGFSENGCKRACIATKNADVQTAMNWVLQHMGDPDFNNPLPGGGSSFPAETVQSLVNMGFETAMVNKALKACNGDATRAVDWLFTHINDPVVEEQASIEDKTSGRKNTGSGKYELMSFITHMGPSSGSGHYVCHIKKDDQWIIFNDQKVNRSQTPAFDLAYLYFFRRV